MGFGDLSVVSGSEPSVEKDRRDERLAFGQAKPALFRLALLFAAFGGGGVACGDSTGEGASAEGGSPSSGGSGGSPTTTNNGGSGASGGSPPNGMCMDDECTTTNAPPVDGCSVLFDGADDVITAAVGDSVSQGDDFSIGAWIRPDPLSDGEIGFVAGRHLDGSNNGFYLNVADEGGDLIARLTVFAPSSTCFAAASLDIPASGLVHVLGSYEAPNARIFIDGELAGEGTCPDEPVDIPAESVFSIGRSSSGVFPYGGEMDEVIYLPDAQTAAFDPETIGCGAVELKYNFDGLTAGETASVPDACGGPIAAVVGTTEGADGNDPTFLCAR